MKRIWRRRKRIKERKISKRKIKRNWNRKVQIAFEIPKSKVIQEYEICPNNEFRFEVIERRPVKQKEKTSKLDNIKTKRN